MRCADARTGEQSLRNAALAKVCGCGGARLRTQLRLRIWRERAAAVGVRLRSAAVHLWRTQAEKQSQKLQRIANARASTACFPLLRRLAFRVARAP